MFTWHIWLNSFMGDINGEIQDDTTYNARQKLCVNHVLSMRHWITRITNSENSIGRPMCRNSQPTEVICLVVPRTTPKSINCRWYTI